MLQVANMGDNRADERRFDSEQMGTFLHHPKPTRMKEPDDGEYLYVASMKDMKQQRSERLRSE